MENHSKEDKPVFKPETCCSNMGLRSIKHMRQGAPEIRLGIIDITDYFIDPPERCSN